VAVTRPCSLGRFSIRRTSANNCASASIAPRGPPTTSRVESALDPCRPGQITQSTQSKFENRTSSGQGDNLRPQPKSVYQDSGDAHRQTESPWARREIVSIRRVDSAAQRGTTTAQAGSDVPRAVARARYRPPPSMNRVRVSLAFNGLGREERRDACGTAAANRQNAFYITSLKRLPVSFGRRDRLLYSSDMNPGRLRASARLSDCCEGSVRQLRAPA
jgi:hypothetical protein